jgi:hypothetical protein
MQPHKAVIASKPVVEAMRDYIEGEAANRPVRETGRFAAVGANSASRI